MGKFKEHGIMLYLDRELYLAFIKLQAEKGLGRSYAGLLPFVEGLHQMGFITDKVYETHKAKYSEPLVAKKQLTLSQLKQKETIEQVAKEFSDVINQWDSMKPEAKKYYIEKAKKYKEKVPNAKLVLALTQSLPKTLFSQG